MTDITRRDVLQGLLAIPAGLALTPDAIDRASAHAHAVRGPDQAAAQPFTYPGGLIEVPMSPISDIGAFRNGRWKLDQFLKAIRLSVEWAIGNGAVFDFTCHPSCLGVVDPECRTVEMICDLVAKHRARAELTDLEAVARLVG